MSKPINLQIEYVAGSNIKDILADMWDRHLKEAVDISAKCNGSHFIIMDEGMYQKFGADQFRSKA